MDVTYAIVKVYVIERNDVIKHQITVITIWRTSAIAVTVLLKNIHSEMKGVQEKEFIMGATDRQKNLSLAITVWHHEASLVMPDCDREGRIFLFTPHTHDRFL